MASWNALVFSNFSSGKPLGSLAILPCKALANSRRRRLRSTAKRCVSNASRCKAAPGGKGPGLPKPPLPNGGGPHIGPPLPMGNGGGMPLPMGSMGPHGGIGPLPGGIIPLPPFIIIIGAPIGPIGPLPLPMASGIIKPGGIMPGGGMPSGPKPGGIIPGGMPGIIPGIMAGIPIGPPIMSSSLDDSESLSLLLLSSLESARLRFFFLSFFSFFSSRSRFRRPSPAVRWRATSLRSASSGPMFSSGSHEVSA
mmetsp:Transcript_105644/g.303808  ORF Transcript_105644/g.303808 Transcript_105644/m.303808 type:complete len:252 (-) Transcript_105644:78-833(-)